jgi:hypothetical protein
MEAAQSAGAITATIGGGAAPYYNPAGIAAGDAHAIDVGANVYGLRIVRAPDLVRGPEGERGGARVVDWMIAPTMLAYVRRFSERWYGAAGIYVSRTSDLSLTAELETREEARWLVAVKFAQSEYYAGLGAGVRLSPRLRIGASLLGVYESQSFNFAQAGHAVDGRAASLINIQSSKSYDLTLRAGVQWQASRWLALGLAVFAPNVVVARRVNHALAVAGANEPAPSSLERRTFRTAGALTGAPGVRAGAAWLYASGWVALDGTLSPPLDSDELELDRKLSFNVRLGWLQAIAAAWKIGAGAFTDRNPLRGRGADYYGLTFGFTNTRRYPLADGRSVSFVTGVSGRYAFGAGESFGTTAPSLTPGSAFLVEERDSHIRNHELSASIGSGVTF